MRAERDRDAEVRRLFLASHLVDWSDGPARLGFVVDVVRAIEMTPGEGQARKQ